jgi:hypothetical protein
MLMAIFRSSSTNAAPQRSFGRELIVNGALTVASVIFFLLILEAGLRIYKAGWVYHFSSNGWRYQFLNFRINQYLAQPMYKYDPEFGWLPKEGQMGPVVSVSADGVRSNGSGEPGDATGTILAVGDSYTFGDQVSDRYTWPAQLEELSGRRVINGGVSGYGIDQSFMRAKLPLSRYRVRTLIFSFIQDDMTRCQVSKRWHLEKPYFELQDGRLTLENVPRHALPLRMRANCSSHSNMVCLCTP